jgi:hypothetical protein
MILRFKQSETDTSMVEISSQNRYSSIKIPDHNLWGVIHVDMLKGEILHAYNEAVEIGDGFIELDCKLIN